MARSRPIRRTAKTSDGAFVVNNIRPEGHPDKLVDVLARGPVFDPPIGCAHVEWDPKAHNWHSAWTRNDVVGTSMVPAMSSASNNGDLLFNSIGSPIRVHYQATPYVRYWH